MSRSKLKSKLFSVTSDNFEEFALNLFHIQCMENDVYREYIRHLGIDTASIHKVDDIPFLPIQFFKGHKVMCNHLEEEVIFESSGTTGNEPARHYVSDPSFYLENTVAIFQHFYNPPQEMVVFGLLPSYLERQGSSLVYMVDHFIQKSHHELSGFYLNEYDQLIEAIEAAKHSGNKILLIGVSFALLDLAENHALDLSDVIVMETGGMKGRRAEITRTELHAVLKQAFHVDQIHSEYGMTELLSQAYSKGNGLFYTPPWMKVSTRQINDPFAIEKHRAGVIRVIDLANIDSCAFIETQDLGKVHTNGAFEVLGRMDHSESRGCNLMYTEL